MVKVAALKGSSHFHPNATSTPYKLNRHGSTGSNKPQKRRASWIDPEDGRASTSKTHSKGIASPAPANGQPSRKKVKKVNGTVAGSSKKAALVREQREQLPIAQGMFAFSVLLVTLDDVLTHVGKDAIIHEIRQHDVTVLVGETGSGKTTRTCI